MAKKQQISIKEQKKIIENQLFGLKNKKLANELNKQLSRLKLMEKQEMEKKKAEQLAKKEQQRRREERKKYEKPDLQKQKEAVISTVDDSEKLICRFLIETPVKLRDQFKCPDPNCTDLHKMKNEETLEDILERQLDSVCPTEKNQISEEEFIIWFAERNKKNIEHKKKKAALKSGIDLFTTNPDLFKEEED